ncbi:hypothetical protein ANME2D_02340 [Candidatus Methanoperedens nitroreducens]|uniref:Uncharacterized protein n=1 Tax=Candidatus Methanoperedens nitratireducens TaxID=1392998 RepID=A0A062V892_9EURY|nr:hypothetical protein [Candidatus Methanoperedens nitroreducens]KCZ71605.1 hypothetical protein ANME2D_02340 [Candidatus Methanoperedens nitroreducens]MDJ1421236.1 hypothetical protein [Candidatus Methanoperedens sp.]
MRNNFKPNKDVFFEDDQAREKERHEHSITCAVRKDMREFDIGV